MRKVPCPGKQMTDPGVGVRRWEVEVGRCVTASVCVLLLWHVAGGPAWLGTWIQRFAREVLTLMVG